MKSQILERNKRAQRLCEARATLKDMCDDPMRITPEERRAMECAIRMMEEVASV